MNKLARLSLVLAMAISGSAGAADEGPIEIVIQRHLNWLAANPQFEAELTFQYGGETGTGTLIVDRPEGKVTILSKTPGLPEGIFLKQSCEADGSVMLSFARGLGRDDDIRLREGHMPAGPFADGTYDVFLPEDGLEATMDRLVDLAGTVALEPESEEGESGVRIVFHEGFMGETMLSLTDFLKADVPPPAPHQATLWFDAEGRLTRADTMLDAESPVQTTTLRYGAPLALAAPVAPVVSSRTPAADPLKELAEPLALSWRVAALMSALLGSLCLALVLRLRGRSVEV